MRYFVWVLILAVSVGGVLGETDVPVTFHVHTTISDGLHYMVVLAECCMTRAIVFSDHLDGVAKYGGDRYLAAVRGCTTSKKLCVPGVEVTAGKSSHSHDVIVVGLTEQSLADLIRRYNAGDFNDEKTGLACLASIAAAHDLVLIAAHPNNSSIPFDLAQNSRYVNGIELFDDSVAGFTAMNLHGNMVNFFSSKTSASIVAGSDYHGVLQGALPDFSLLEVPTTHTLISGEVSEQSIVDAIRQGRVYASSYLPCRVKFMTRFPGGEWVVTKDDEEFEVRCEGFPKNLLHDAFSVVVFDGQYVKTVRFRPCIEDGIGVLKIRFGDLGMPNAKSMLVDLGGRFVSSTIAIRRVEQKQLLQARREEPPQQAKWQEPPQPEARRQTQGGGGNTSGSLDFSQTVFALDMSPSIEVSGVWQQTIEMFGNAIGDSIEKAWIVWFFGTSARTGIRRLDEITDGPTFVKRAQRGSTWGRGTIVLDALYEAGELAQEKGAKTVVLISDMNDTDSKRDVGEILRLYDQADLRCIMLIAPQRVEKKKAGDNGSKVYMLSQMSPRFALLTCEALVSK